MKKSIIISAVVLSVVSILLLLLLIPPVPATLNRDADVISFIKSQQIDLTGTIAEFVNQHKSENPTIQNLQLSINTNIALKDSTSNSIKYTYETTRWIIPPVIHKQYKRNLCTKYFIGSDGAIFVYSFYLPVEGDRTVLVTQMIKNEKPEQKYLSEKELLSVLSKNGLDLKQLSETVPSYVVAKPPSD